MKTLPSSAPHPTRPVWLFIIETDPRSSPRPAEAIRIAAGVAVWKSVDVRVYLREAAILVLGTARDGLRDEENFAQFLPLLAESQDSILVEAHSRYLREAGALELPHRAISSEEAATLAAECSHVSRF